MKKKELDDWKASRESERREQSRAALDNIGQQLQLKLAKIVAEPLPSEIHDLLEELAKVICASRNLSLQIGRSPRKNIPS